MGKLEKAKKIARYVAPIRPDLDKQVEKAMKRKDIKKAYKEFRGDPTDFRAGLRNYIEQVNADNKNLRRFAAYLDIVNKATVPLDVAIDAFNIVFGVGTGARAIKTLAMLPGYLAYNAYYLGKTHDVVGTLGQAAYELGSWITLGRLPHLVNYYTWQADRYAVKEGSEEFLENIGGLEEKIIEFPKEEELERAA